MYKEYYKLTEIQWTPKRKEQVLVVYPVASSDLELCDKERVLLPIIYSSYLYDTLTKNKIKLILTNE